MTDRLVINHATVREKMDMTAFVKACSRRGLSMVSIWENEIDRIGKAAAKEVLTQTGSRVFGYNRAGPLLASSATERRQRLDAAKRSIDLALEFDADHVLLFPGGAPEGEKGLDGARGMTEEAVGHLLDHLGDGAARLALEPLHPMLAGDRSSIVSMSHANDICDRLGRNLGIVVDVYHVWWDERLDEEIARAGKHGRIAGFHVNDWLVPTKHTLTDRGMMGDGVIDLAHLWNAVKRAGYDGPIEVEIFSDDWWARDADAVIDLCIERCASIFGLVMERA
ncbi:sugar phosphate isomerase/epimerase [Hoeflea sp. WL0058]|uniref:Sugar phosphate isomerase/epimerase n=1 Tax=Flavimaribacter sediminis TaxID=2865987 RepID=A0AAE3CZZ9_9HYPH|nr:sugar phosphate isomerase/epimerase family protein [Flavimaribacter sediminis]MBW8637179.1 sugar phosphate isomerase/epimerase [Flavimaribacter sediminis]